MLLLQKKTKHTMKQFYLALSVFTLLLSSISLNAQNGIDKTIAPVSGENQTSTDISVAFNGWTYSVVTFYDGVNGGYHVKRSKNNGKTWESFDDISVPNIEYSALDIEVAGTDTNNLVLYVAGVNHNTTTDNYVLYVDRYNATTGIFIGSNYNRQFGTRKVYDVMLASDYKLPAIGVNPYSVGLAYSCFSSSYDSVNFVLSIDGGVTFGSPRSVATTSSYFRNLSVAYGQSASASNGRYFLAWEQMASSTAKKGHIYTSRNTSVVTDPFINPINLDSISPSCINLCSNPSIAVSYLPTDNDSSSVTAIVAFQRDYNNDGTDFDLLSFVNHRAHFTNFWFRADVNNTGDSDKNPSIVFDAATAMFYGAYADSTNGQIKYFTAPNNFASGIYTLSPNLVNDAPLNWGTKQVYPIIAKGATKSYPEFTWINNSTDIGTGYYNADQIQLAITSTLTSPTTSANIPVTFTFGSPVTNFDIADIVVTNGNLSGFSGSAATYTATLIPNAAGIVTIDVANDVATINNANATFSIDYQPLGVNEFNALDMFKVFPNPTTGMVYISGHDNSAPIQTIRVFTTTGQMVTQVNLEGSVNGSCDMNNLQAGMYLVEITLVNGNHGVSRIVKM